jgi:hypothetical protein
MGSCVMKNTSDLNRTEMHSARDQKKDINLHLAFETDIK